MQSFPAVASQPHGLSDDRFQPAILPLEVPAVPSIFTLELTTACPHLCSGCANVEMGRAAPVRAKNIVVLEAWRQLLHRIEPHARLVRLSGGEPTLHPDFADIVREVDHRNLPHALLTTGRWSARKNRRLIALYRECRHFVGFLVSLHGATASAHGRFIETSDQAFDDTCRNIRALSAAGLMVYTNAVLTRWVCNEIEPTVRLALALGARYVIFNRFIGPPHPAEPTPAQLEAAIREIESLRAQGVPCRIGNNIPPCFAANSSEGAKAGYELCHVSPNGGVRPDNLTQLHFGNLLQEPLESIWQSPMAELYRLSFPSACRTCAAFSRCRGGAKSITLEYNLTQDRLMRGPLNHRPDHPDDDPPKRQLAYLALTSD